jgi:hypothetical protein
VTTASSSIERVGDERFEQGRQPRRQVGRLDQHAVAGGERGDRRPERELQRIVPRRHHADDTARLRRDPVVARPEMRGGRHAALAHPLPQVRARMAQAATDHEQFGELRLVRGASAEIGVDRLHERGFMRIEQRAQTVEPRQADRERRRGIARIGGALAFEAGGELGWATRSHGVSSGVLASFGRRLMTPMVRAAWENTNAGSGQLF